MKLQGYSIGNEEDRFVKGSGRLEGALALKDFSRWYSDCKEIEKERIKELELVRNGLS